MKVLKVYNQTRIYCTVDLECENCGELTTNGGAYDDGHYWDNVIPDQKCDKCGKTSNDLGIKNEKFATRYPEGFQV